MQSEQTTAYGRFENETISSEALRDNPLGDPAERSLIVYLPPAYEQDTQRRFPVIYVIQGYTGQVDMWWNQSPFKPTVPERIDELFADPDVPAAIVVFVDAWTSLGGSQFLNSPGTGRYLDYLSDEIPAFIDSHYRTLADRDHRGLTGKSSGGYGAMVVPMLRPDVWGALASHAGDAQFEMCYMPDIAVAARALRDRYDAQYSNFWADFHSRPPFSKKEDAALLNTYAMAACYSAEPDGSVTLPFDTPSGLFRDDVWQRWLAVDPVRMADSHADTLRALRGIYLDAGRSDEFYLDIGATAFAAKLDHLDIPYTLELFEGGHGGIDYRYPGAIRFLAERLAAPVEEASP